MSRLISANLTRAFKGTLLWLVSAAALIFSGMNAGEMLKYYSPAAPERCIETVFNGIPIMAVLIPAFSGLFLGSDYQCGTLRTKILSGSSRESVYISNFFTVFVCSIIILCASLLPAAVTFMIFVENPFAFAGKLLLNFLASVMITASLSAIFTLMGMLISSKSAGAVAAILFALIMIAAGSFFYNILCEPKFISDMTLSANGEVISGEPYPNPTYIGGWLRIAFQAVLLLLPTGQGILLANNEMSHYLLCCTASLSVTVIISLFGVMFFYRKDLR